MDLYVLTELLVRDENEDILNWLAPDRLLTAQSKLHKKVSEGRANAAGEIFVRGKFTNWIALNSTHIWIHGAGIVIGFLKKNNLLRSFKSVMEKAIFVSFSVSSRSIIFSDLS